MYRASLPTDAHLCHHWLRRNGIPAEVRGDLAIGRGELPIQESAPSVWVPEIDADRALELIAEFETPQGDGTRWLCARCGEDNEPNFGSCWSCGADRTQPS